MEDLVTKFPNINMRLMLLFLITFVLFTIPIHEANGWVESRGGEGDVQQNDTENEIPDIESNTTSLKVVHITDGDTFVYCKVSDNSELYNRKSCIGSERPETVRLYKINTPEVKGKGHKLDNTGFDENLLDENGKKIEIPDIECLDKIGAEASVFATNTLHGKRVDTNSDVGIKKYMKDRYYRTLADVTINGEDYAKLILQNGYGVVFRGESADPNFVVEQEYYNIETKARENRKGLWQCNWNLSDENIGFCEPGFDKDNGICVRRPEIVSAGEESFGLTAATNKEADEFSAGTISTQDQLLEFSDFCIDKSTLREYVAEELSQIVYLDYKCNCESDVCKTESKPITYKDIVPSDHDRLQQDMSKNLQPLGFLEAFFSFLFSLFGQ